MVVREGAKEIEIKIEGKGKGVPSKRRCLRECVSKKGEGGDENKVPVEVGFRAISQKSIGQNGKRNKYKCLHTPAIYL